MNWELDYLLLMQRLIDYGDYRKGRNGGVYSLPFLTLEVPALTYQRFPLLTTRKMYYKGILGEYAAFIREPTHIDDFKRWGCNYWDTWADKNGNLNIDYGNAWGSQMERVVETLRSNPFDRRMLIDAWRPDAIDDLSLPCCHYSYQFWSDGSSVDLLWNQRSADWAIGVPSDIVLAATMLLCFASCSGLKPGNIKMVFGDAHIYEEHLPGCGELLTRSTGSAPHFIFKEQADIRRFEPEDIEIMGYIPEDPIKFELKA